MRLTLALLLVVAPGLYAQAMVSNAAAVAAGTAMGTAGGKQVAPALGVILDKMGGVTSKAAQPREAVDAKAKPVAPPVDTEAKAPAVLPSSGPAGPMGSSGGSISPHPHRTRVAVQAPPRVALPSATPAPEPPSPVAVPPAPAKNLTAEDVAAITNGMAAEEVLLKLGKPASRMSIPQEDGLLEVCRYYGAGGMDLGSVRMLNGVVSTVAPNLSGQ